MENTPYERVEHVFHQASGPPALFDYLRSDVRNLSRYMAELEELIEGNRTFATSRWATTRRAWPS